MVSPLRLGPPSQLNLLEGGSGHPSQQALQQQAPLPESELSFPGLARESRASSQAPSWAGMALPPLKTSEDGQDLGAFFFFFLTFSLKKKTDLMHTKRALYH